MKFVAAYLLAALGGNTSPSCDDLKGVLGSGVYFLSSQVHFLLLKDFFF